MVKHYFASLSRVLAAAAAVFTAVTFAYAHQQPTTIASLDVTPETVGLQLEIPLTELELAFGHNVTADPDARIAEWRSDLSKYLIEHIKPVSPDGSPWSVKTLDFSLSDASQEQSGPYREVIATLVLQPPSDSTTRKFTLHYDVIMHQVVTHIALLSVRNDWESGVRKDNPAEIGVIRVDTETTQIFPLEINLEQGSPMTGFRSMVALGMEHIREGTDHLLFLLVLLLPATLTLSGRRWGGYGGAQYGVARLLKIVTAFTIGHSITLLIGAIGWFTLPQQPVEIIIAVSILISAIHAVRPVFPGNEVFVAGGFGLVHGLAFATVLSEMNVTSWQLGLSLFGFNLGIELMQIGVITLIVPWLILLSQTKAYAGFRFIGASFAAIAASAWIVERVSGNPNIVTSFVQSMAEHAHIGVLALAGFAMLTWTLSQRERPTFS